MLPFDRMSGEDLGSREPVSDIDSTVVRLLEGVELGRAGIESLILRIDNLVQAQVNAILHAKEVQELERTWRSLKVMVDRMDFSENIQLAILNVTKEELLDDFEDHASVTNSALYRRVYTDEFGTFGGEPYALVCANFEFGLSTDDMLLLRQCAAVAAMAHAPFVSNVGPSFFGEESLRHVPALADLESLFEAPQYSQWHKLRKNPDARNVGLCLPRFLLRVPYGESGTVTRAFAFEEHAPGHHDRYLWGPASALFACRVADSFAKYRWCPNITGAQSGGKVEGLLHYQYEVMGELVSRIPTEFQVTDVRERELERAGFVPLTYRKRDRSGCFYSATSIHQPDLDARQRGSKSVPINDYVAKQLPYLFIITRLAHYIKVVQREELGSWIDAAEVEKNLSDWIRKYVADMDMPGAAVRARRPLRRAEIKVFKQEDQVDWLRCHVEVTPHFRYLGSNFSLSLVGVLEQGAR